MEALLFQMDDKWYAVDISYLDEILMMANIKPIPSSPDFISGVLNLRGELIPVIDLRNKLGHRLDFPYHNSMENPIMTHYRRDSRIIVITIHDRRIGLIAHGLKKIQKIVPEQRHESVIEQGAIPPYINGMAVNNGEMIQIIDINKVLNDDEIAMLRENQMKS